MQKVVSIAPYDEVLAAQDTSENRRQVTGFETTFNNTDNTLTLNPIREVSSVKTSRKSVF